MHHAVDLAHFADPTAFAFDDREGCLDLVVNASPLGMRGQPPLALVTSGTQDGLMAVRRFLDAARGGVYMPPNALDAAFTPYEDTDIVIR